MSDASPTDFDRAQWKDARWSRWSFRNTASFLPTISIAPSSQPRPLAFGEPWQPSGWDGFLAATHAASAILIADGQVAAAWPAGAQSDPRPHMLFSITKSIVGLTARMLIDAGEIEAERDAADYVPDLAGSAFGEARLTDLLAMRDGVPFDETYADPEADIHRYSRGYWGEVPGGARARLAALPRLPRLDGFAYRTPVADVVGAMVSAATGARLADLVGELIWRPMGAGHAAHFVLDTGGVEIAGAGLNAATSDLARLALLLLGEGAWGGRQVVPEHIVAELFAGGDGVGVGDPARSGWSYRDLWWHIGEGRIAALGVHGQRLIIDRKRGFALVRTGTQPQPDNRPFDGPHDAVLDMIKRKPPSPRQGARLIGQDRETPD